MINEILLSIIIPVYNTEKYLAKCLDSIVINKNKCLEIVIVDDGSTDGSAKICDMYAEKDNRIVVIHTKNHGLSEARNKGINSAKGTFVTFVDSDDFWTDDFAKKEIIKIIRQYKDVVDVFQFPSYEYSEKYHKIIRDNVAFYNKINDDNIIKYYDSCLSNGHLNVSAWSKICKKDFLVNNNLYFKKGITGEDSEWTIRMLRVLKRLKVLRKPYYAYRIDREGSITSSVSVKNVNDLVNIINTLSDDEFNQKSEIEKYEKGFMCFLFFVMLGFAGGMNKEDKKQAKPLFKEMENICDYSIMRQTNICRFVYKTLGYKFTAKLLNIYFNMQ